MQLDVMKTLTLVGWPIQRIILFFLTVIKYSKYYPLTHMDNNYNIVVIFFFLCRFLREIPTRIKRAYFKITITC
jgi:hypothetical protein